jgi:hypothetical protein
VDEIPYDFQRRRLSVIVQDQTGSNLLISKGALKSILEVCKFIENNGEDSELSPYIDKINGSFSFQVGNPNISERFFFLSSPSVSIGDMVLHHQITI